MHNNNDEFSNKNRTYNNIRANSTAVHSIAIIPIVTDDVESMTRNPCNNSELQYLGILIFFTFISYINAVKDKSGMACRYKEKTNSDDKIVF